MFQTFDPGTKLSIKIHPQLVSNLFSFFGFFQMRSGRTAGTTAGSKWDPGQIGGNANGYSSSDDDEMTRLKPTPGNGSGTNTSAGSSSGHGGHRHSR